MHTLGPVASAADVETQAAHTGVICFPIRSRDELLGHVHLKDMLDVAPADRDRPLSPTAIRRLPDVSAGLPLADAIEVMRVAGTPIARYATAGRRSGLITLDDVLAGLVAS